MNHLPLQLPILPILRDASERVVERYEEEYSIAATISPDLPKSMLRLIILARMTNVSELVDTLSWDPVYNAMRESDIHLKMIVDNLTYYLASWGFDLSTLAKALTDMIAHQTTNHFNDGDDRKEFSREFWMNFLSQNSWACTFILLKIGRIPQSNLPDVEPNADADTDQE